MINSQLPVWYPLQEAHTPVFKPTMAEIEELIKQRVEVYKSSENDFDFVRDRFETESEYFDRISVDRKGFTVMKIGVSLDPKLSSWFTEFEGDLFQARFERSEWELKTSIMDELFPIDDFGPNWLELSDLEVLLGEDLVNLLNIPSERLRIESAKRSRFRQFRGEEYGMQKVVGVNFRYAAYHLKKRDQNVWLYKGWVILSVDRLSTTIKHRFEDLLRIDLEKFVERIETEGSGEIKRLPGQINEIVRKLLPARRKTIEFGGVNLEGTLIENLNLYPPCIQDLMTQVEESGYLPHMERFQLGLFLKHIGVEVDEQMEYWFTKAVDNLNISFDEFKGKVGYIIRHLYGLEGGKIDYEMPSCETIQTKMYCTFRHQEIEGINDKIKQYMNTQSGQDQLIKLPLAQEVSEIASKGFANMACAKYLELVTDKTTDKIFHPMQYLRDAAKVFGKLKETDVDDPEESAEEEEVSE